MVTTYYLGMPFANNFTLLDQYAADPWIGVADKEGLLSFC
jgi:hypothetical protein